MRRASKLSQRAATPMSKFDPNRDSCEDEAILQLQVLRELVINHYHSDGAPEAQFRDCLATLFNIGLQILLSKGRSDIDSLTWYMKAFFDVESDGRVRYVTIMNIDPDGYPIRFSFASCTFD